MRMVHRTSWLLFVVAAACRPAPPEPSAGSAPPSVEQTHEEEENAIHLSDDTARDLRISTAQVVERTGLQESTLLGEVAADQTRYAQVVPPTAGQVVRVLVDTDTVVAAGSPLAVLRSNDVGRARADLVSAEAKRDLASQTLDRRRGLAAERIVPLREVQEAEAAFRAADAEARAAAGVLAALGVTPGSRPVDDDGREPRLQDPSLFELRSPIGGRVIDRRAVRGQFADASTPLFAVADLTRVWIVGQAFERDAVNVDKGTLAHVTLAALPGQEFDGRVALVGRQVDAGSRTLPIRIELANPSGVLRPGMSASVRLDVGGGARRMLVVPAPALQRVGTRWLAFVPTGPFEYEMRPVGRGRDVGTDVEVLSGLKAGETVVVEGAFLLKAEAEKRQGGADEHGH